ncbi:hypothetical protein QFC24_006746 [Naganishia onofrii]|uniref:Uncharacterized protein n=1 Tax=Naganishia onofrii TaxID=1851511 RepID=A0ACC2WXK8_9TREE|nr:hypothetical protein QFC24_006746 [Naganishia onofrii]
MSKALLAAFENEAVKNKLKQTEGTNYHAIPDSDTIGDADRAMAFLEMLTGLEAEKFEGTTVKDIRSFINPLAQLGPDTRPDGRQRLDYNPTIVLDKKNKIRAIRPTHSNERQNGLACPMPPPGQPGGYSGPDSLNDFYQKGQAQNLERKMDEHYERGTGVYKR